MPSYFIYAVTTIEQKYPNQISIPVRLGIDQTPDFFLELEDYLSGLTQMSNELSRFSVNSVTHGCYDRPQRIAAFLNELLVRQLKSF